MPRQTRAAKRRRQRCTATAKSTKERCNRWAVEGYQVCVVHGAGTKKRQVEAPADGRLRQEPATAGIKTGKYATFTKARMKDAAAAMVEEGEHLFHLETMAARLWATLLAADEVEASFQMTALQSRPTPEFIDDIEDPVQRAEIAMQWEENESKRCSFAARDILQRLQMIRGCVHELLEATRVRQKLDDRHGPTITKGQLEATLTIVALWVHELSLDESVARDQIAPKLFDRFRRVSDFMEDTGS